MSLCIIVPITVTITASTKACTIIFMYSIIIVVYIPKNNILISHQFTSSLFHYILIPYRRLSNRLNIRFLRFKNMIFRWFRNQKKYRLEHSPCSKSGSIQYANGKGFRNFSSSCHPFIDHQFSFISF